MIKNLSGDYETVEYDARKYVMLYDNNVPIDKSPIYDYIYYCLRRDLKL